MHFCFVILHYNAIDVTRRCIGLLLDNFVAKDISIVVVDNASPDGSGAELQTCFSEESRVHLILLDRNEGFARGNNAGYRLAVKKLNPDFIIMMNNDVFVHDRDFTDKLAKEYRRSPFAVLGPDIVSKTTGRHQNPFALEPMTEKEARRRKKMIDNNLRHFLFHYICWGIKRIFKIERNSRAFETPARGCVLHGACLIFSKDFINSREYAFNPGTFLFVEEDILQYECAKAGLTMRYSPLLKVEHLEDASSKTVFRTKYFRTKSQYIHSSYSLGVLLDLMKKSSNENILLSHSKA